MLHHQVSFDCVFRFYQPHVEAGEEFEVDATEPPKYSYDAIGEPETFTVYYTTALGLCAKGIISHESHPQYFDDKNSSRSARLFLDGRRGTETQTSRQSNIEGHTGANIARRASRRARTSSSRRPTPRSLRSLRSNESASAGAARRGLPE